jgi:hypothetical protein
MDLWSMPLRWAEVPWPYFRKFGSDIEQFFRGINIQIHRQKGDLISQHFFFVKIGTRLKMGNVGLWAMYYLVVHSSHPLLEGLHSASVTYATPRIGCKVGMGGTARTTLLLLGGMIPPLSHWHHMTRLLHWKISPRKHSFHNMLFNSYISNVGNV